MPPTASMSGGPVLLETSPFDGAEDVPRLGPFIADVDRSLLPRTVSRGTVRVESGVVRHLLTVRFDPIARRIVAAPFYETPLEPNVVYRFIIEDVRDLDGRALDEPYVARFRTSLELGERLPETVAPWSDVAPLFTTRCALAECHGGPAPILGLDLSTAERVAATAIGVPSRQRPNAGPESSRGGLGFGGLARVETLPDTGYPEESYLIYKVLGDPHIEGDRMPPSDFGPPLTPAEIAALGAWIRGGAPTR